MGFFGALGKIIAGKPVYGPDNAAQPVGAQPEGRSQQNGTKQVPFLHIGRVECHTKPGHIEVYVDIENHSGETVFVDDITVLGKRREIQRQYRPGEGRQEYIYSGESFSRQPNGYTELRFRKQADGDYFLNYYQLVCRQQSDGSYSIGEFRPAGPSKDI